MYLGVVARDGRLPVLRRVRPRAVATTLVEADDAVVRRVEELPRDVEGRGLGGYQPGVYVLGGLSVVRDATWSYQ